MSENNVRTAVTGDVGARFLRVALQVNSHAYLIEAGTASRFGGAAEYDRAMVDACVAAELDAIGLTDHYSVNTSSSLRAAAEAAGIVVFPGFEAQTSEGVHLLVLFNPGTDLATMERAIGECGVVRRQGASPLGKLDVTELTAAAKKWGAITIAAHATTTGKGLLTALKGQARMKAWCSPELLAIGIPGSIATLAESDRLIIENANVDYQRPRRIAVINAQDVTDPEQIAGASATTLVKMSEVTVEGLRQAFLDPHSRIRLNSDPAPTAHSRFLRLGWEGGFLRGVSVDLNENLNVLIGGRGAGKSCVIESIRYVLGQSALGLEAKRLHEAIVSQVLGNATKITLGVRIEGPTPRDYLVERTVGNLPVIRAVDGTVLRLQPRDLLGVVTIYGQHEISELAKSPPLLTSLLEPFVALDPQLSVRRTDRHN